MAGIAYAGRVREFRQVVLPEVRRAGMRGLRLDQHAAFIQVLIDSAKTFSRQEIRRQARSGRLTGGVSTDRA